MKTPGLLILSLFLFSCSSLDTQTKATEAIVAGSDLYVEYKTGDVADSVILDTFTDVELEIVVNAIDYIEKEKPVLESYKHPLILFSVPVEELTAKYSILAMTYETVRKVVVNHWDEYTDSQRKVFIELDKSAIIFDTATLSLFDTINKNETVNNSLKLMNSTLKVIAVMGLL